MISQIFQVSNDCNAHCIVYMLSQFIKCFYVCVHCVLLCIRCVFFVCSPRVFPWVIVLHVLLCHNINAFHIGMVNMPTTTHDQGQKKI